MKQTSYQLLLSRNIMEQVMGVEPTSSDWKSDLLTVIRYLHVRREFATSSPVPSFFGLPDAREEERNGFPEPDSERASYGCGSPPFALHVSPNVFSDSREGSLAVPSGVCEWSLLTDKIFPPHGEDWSR